MAEMRIAPVIYPEEGMFYEVQEFKEGLFGGVKVKGILTNVGVFSDVNDPLALYGGFMKFKSVRQAREFLQRKFGEDIVNRLRVYRDGSYRESF